MNYRKFEPAEMVPVVAHQEIKDVAVLRIGDISDTQLEQFVQSWRKSMQGKPLMVLRESMQFESMEAERFEDMLYEQDIVVNKHQIEVDVTELIKKYDSTIEDDNRHIIGIRINGTVLPMSACVTVHVRYAPLEANEETHTSKLEGEEAMAFFKELRRLIEIPKKCVSFSLDTDVFKSFPEIEVTYLPRAKRLGR